MFAVSQISRALCSIPTQLSGRSTCNLGGKVRNFSSYKEPKDSEAHVGIIVGALAGYASGVLALVALKESDYSKPIEFVAAVPTTAAGVVLCGAAAGYKIGTITARLSPIIACVMLALYTSDDDSSMPSEETPKAKVSNLTTEEK